MIDPRNDIIALFTDGKVSGATDYGTGYIGIDLVEDNEEKTIKDNTDLGLIILEVPVGYPELITVGGKTYEDGAIIKCNLWIYKDKPIKNHPDYFINNIIDAFQNKIIDNNVSLSSCEEIKLQGAVNVIPSGSDHLYRRSWDLFAHGFKIR